MRVNICELERGDTFYDPDCQPQYIHRFCGTVPFSGNDPGIDYAETHTVGYMKDKNFVFNIGSVKDQYNPSAMVVRVQLQVTEVE